MEKASLDLINEHKAILLTLEVLEKMSDKMVSGKDVDFKDIIGIIDFLKIFADKCHHGKEENYFFPALEEAGISKENGPIGVMLEEHTRGRILIKQMQDTVLSNTIQKEEFVNSSRAYVNLLRNHINKENNVLFPMGDERLTGEKQKELLINFEKYEEEVIGKGKHEELHLMLNRFKVKYLS